jgi:hypothetical protein
VVVLVPIAVRVPAVVVFIPPLMPLTPATLARVVQFTTLVICLFAVAPVFVDCLVEFMLQMRICFAFTFPNNRKSGGIAVEFQGLRPDFSPSPARPSSALREDHW